MPRVLPKDAPPDVRAGLEQIERDHAERHARILTPYEPYVRGGPHSFFGDLLRLSRADERAGKAMESPLLRGFDPGEDPDASTRGDSLAEVRDRLRRYHVARTTLGSPREKRDLSSSNVGDALRPSAPGYLADVFGQASKATGTLADVFDRPPLEPGMVDTSSGVPVVSIPRFSSGAATAVQASQNSAVQETDPVSAAASSPVVTIAGRSDYSQQLLDFSQPGIDEVIADDLGRDFGSKLDIQIVNGSAVSGQTRGLLNWSGILSVAGAVTSVQAFVADVWQAFQELSGSSGFGNPDPAEYVTILHPRRLARIHSGAGATSVPAAPVLPGRVVASAGIPANLGAGTNEDVALVVERSNVLLLADSVKFRVYEETGSGTVTVRTSAWGYGAVLVKNAVGIAKVTGLTPPTYA